MSRGRLVALPADTGPARHDGAKVRPARHTRQKREIGDEEVEIVK